MNMIQLEYLLFFMLNGRKDDELCSVIHLKYYCFEIVIL